MGKVTSLYLSDDSLEILERIPASTLNGKINLAIQEYESGYRAEVSDVINEFRSLIETFKSKPN